MYIEGNADLDDDIEDFLNEISFERTSKKPKTSDHKDSERSQIDDDIENLINEHLQEEEKQLTQSQYQAESNNLKSKMVPENQSQNKNTNQETSWPKRAQGMAYGCSTIYEIDEEEYEEETQFRRSFSKSVSRVSRNSNKSMKITDEDIMRIAAESVGCAEAKLLTSKCDMVEFDNLSVCLEKASEVGYAKVSRIMLQILDYEASNDIMVMMLSDGVRTLPCSIGKSNLKEENSSIFESPNDDYSFAYKMASYSNRYYFPPNTLLTKGLVLHLEDMTILSHADACSGLILPRNIINFY